MFGGSSKGSALTTNVIPTGGQIDDLVMTLISVAYDRSSDVRETMIGSLKEIGMKQPLLMLSSCGNFLSSSKKIPTEHRILILKIMLTVLKEQLGLVTPELGGDLVLLSVQEMTSDKEIIPEWQEAALGVLVCLGTRFGEPVLQELLSRFESKSLPHFFLIKALGDLATANSQYVVPELKEIFGRMLPLLGMIKRDNQRWVFAATVGQFCEAIVAYVDENDDESITMASFHGEVYTAFDLMFNTWLEIKAPQVRNAVVRAIGSMCPVMDTEQFQTVLPKLIGTYMALYKKPKDLLPITQGLSNILKTAVASCPDMLDEHLMTLLDTLHKLVCIPPDFEDNASLKNFNELLRCFETLGLAFSEQLVNFLLARLDNNSPNVRIGTLGVIKHIIPRLTEQLETQMELIVAGVKPILGETDNRVKRAFAQVIIAMASHEYLELEGGELLVEFIVECSALPEQEDARKKVDKRAGEPIPNVALRNMCDNVLNLITTTIPCMIEVMWPFLFETVVPAKFTGALPVVCKCLTFLAEDRMEEEAEDFYIDFDRAVNLPKPPAIVARLLTMLAFPFERGVGSNILDCLLAISEIIHPSVEDLWTDLIPKLLAWLEKNSDEDDFKQTAWEELVQRFLSMTIDEIEDDDWTMRLGEALNSQFELYSGEFTKYKRMVHKLLGIVLKKTGHKKFVRERLNDMFDVLDPNDPTERQGFAQGFGFAGASHLDTVLEKLQHIMKNDMQRKKTGFLGMGRDKSVGEVEAIQCCVMLSFGYVAAYADVGLIPSRAEVHIISPIMPYFASAKSPSVKESMVKAIDLIGKAVHPDHLESDAYKLKQRDELVSSVLAFIVSGSAVEVQAASFNTISTLALLKPAMPAELASQVVDQSLPIVCALEDPSSDEEDSSSDGEDSPVDTCVNNFNQMLCSILFMHPSIATLTALFRNLEPYLTAEEALHRERALTSIVVLLSKYIKFRDAMPDGAANCFREVGHWLAVVIPRCTDPDEDVRVLAVEAVEMMLYVDWLHADGAFGAGGEDSEDDDELPENEDTAAIGALKDRILADDTGAQFSAVHAMTQVIAKMLSAEELPDFLQTLTDGLTDGQDSSASGTCVVLNGMIRLRGPELENRISDLVHAMIFAMAKINNEQTMNGTLHALRTLARHHLILVLNELLGTAVPHSDHVVKSLQVLAKDDALAVPMVDFLVDIVRNSMPYEKKGTGKDGKKTDLPIPTSAAAAIGDICEADLEDVVQEHFASLLSALLLRVGIANGVTAEYPKTNVVEALQRFLSAGQETEMMEDMEGSWELLSSPDYHKGLVVLTRSLCNHRDDMIEEVFDILEGYIASNYPEQRVVVSSVFSELINALEDEPELLQKLLNNVLRRLVDDHVEVKRYTLRGLGNLAGVGESAVNKYSTTVLSTLISGVDGQSEDLVLEAMEALSRILEVVDGKNVAPVLITLCLRIRPSFKHDNPEIRTAAVTLFGRLWRFGNTAESRDDFYEQIHALVINLVLHSDDEDVAVAAACRDALVHLAALMRDDDVRDTLLTLGDGGPDSFDTFLEDMAVAVIGAYPERLNFMIMECVALFDHTEWYQVKARACQLTGFLLGHMSPELRRNVNLDHICSAIKNLLKETKSKGDAVRAKAAIAVSLIYDC